MEITRKNKKNMKVFSTKSKTSSLLFLLTLSLLLSISFSADTCSAGMTQIYINSTSFTGFGSAQAGTGEFLLGNGNGAVWFNRRILVMPRFEMHLKASLDYASGSDEQTFDGFTFVISKARSKTVGEGSADTIGYYGFTNSYVAEFDFKKDTNDPDASSFSFRYCDSSCSSDDVNAIYKAKLSDQRYSSTVNMSWDFKLIYSDNKLQFYSGANTLLYTYTVNLWNIFGEPGAYIGHTAYLKTSKRTLKFSGFVCEDDYDMAKMHGLFLFNGEKTSTVSLTPTQHCTYLDSFKNVLGQDLPVLKLGIWTYDLHWYLSGASNFTSNVIRDETYHQIDFTAGTSCGKHYFRVEDVKYGHGSSDNTYYYIFPGAFNNLTLQDVAINLIEKDETEANTYFLKTGPHKGYYRLSSDLTISFNFKHTDNWGCQPVINDTDSETLLSKTALSLVTPRGAVLSMKNNDEHTVVTLNIKPSQIGVYQIPTSKYLTNSYKFEVKKGEIDVTKSYCTLSGYSSSPTLIQGKDVSYVCVLKDVNGLEITAKEFDEDYEDYFFLCGLERTSPLKSSYNPNQETVDNRFHCKYSINAVGQFAFNSYIYTVDGKTTIPPKINTFTSAPSSYSLVNANVYDPTNKQWVSFDSTFLYKADSKGFLTALDLTDDSNLILMSTFKTFPENFDVSAISAVLTSSHDDTFVFKTLKTKIIEIDGVQYVGVYTKDEDSTDNTVLKSSFVYTIKFYLNKEQKNVYMRYVFEKPTTNGGITTCFHDLKESKTEVSFNSVNLEVGANEVLLGTLTLKTSDDYLYNYDIGTSKISLKLQSGSGFNYRLVSSGILGIYNIYANATLEFDSYIDISVNSQVAKSVKAEASKPKACSLEFSNSDSFNSIAGSTYIHYYEYVGKLTDDDKLSFNFNLQDESGNNVVNSIFDKNNTYISCPQLEDSSDYYSVNYDSKNNYYTFEDKIDTLDGVYEWVIETPACSQKYIIRYDRSNYVTVSQAASYFQIVKSELEVAETGYVDVYLRDKKNRTVGQVSGILAKELSKVAVKGTKDSSSVSFTYNQITNANAIRYFYTFTTSGTYTIAATYDGKELYSDNNLIKVTSKEISLQQSKLYILLATMSEMSETKVTTINNANQIPVYRLMLYNSEGQQLTSYDKDIEVKCVMTDDSLSWTLNVDKTNSEYIEFTYDDETKQQFSHLKQDFYNLVITLKTSKKTYALYLLGEEGSDDASNLKDYDLTQTYVSPTVISGVAGNTYTVNVELRAKDGLRWNYEGDDSLFTFSNSYNLASPKFTTKVQKGGKKGQFIISIVQQTATTGKSSNVLTLKYNGNAISQTVSIIMKCADLSYLKYESGFRDGTINDLPILKFIPYDKYDNIYTDLFDSSTTSKSSLEKLTIGKSVEGVPLTTNNYVSDSKYLNVQYQSTLATTVKVSSSYFNETYTYRIGSSDIDQSKSWAELKTVSNKNVDTTHDIVIYPRDQNGNEIDNLTEEEMKKFSVYYKFSDSSAKTYFSDSCKIVDEYTASSNLRRLLITKSEKNKIQCSTTITKIGSVQFYVDYNYIGVECKSCSLTIYSTEVDFTKTEAVYTNLNTQMSTSTKTKVAVTVLPTFQLTFKDKYGNTIIDEDSISKINITPTFSGSDVKLCATNSGYHININVCTASNGDDNQNKWLYLSNGDDYSLTITENSNKITYPLSLYGGDDSGSSAEVDLTKTVFTPESVSIMAGEEGSVLMELRTTDNKRKSYWYPDPSKNISITFTEDKDYCTQSFSKASNPGQYFIHFVCTKKNSANSFTTKVNGNVAGKQISVNVKAGYSYTLEPLDSSLFNVDGTQYTFKTNPTNDESISFYFKLKDKYENLLDYSDITTTKTDIYSETYTNSTYLYTVTYDSSKSGYLFVDKITDVGITHSWDISCETSGKKYVFTYTKDAGKVVTGNSFYKVDSTSHFIGEDSVVEVTLKDSQLMNVAQSKNKIESEKNNIVVQAVGNSKTYTYTYDSISTTNTLVYKYNYDTAGTYVITVKYNGNLLTPESVTLTISYASYSLTNSEVYIQKTTGETFMRTNRQTNIITKSEFPYFKFYFVSSSFERITDYDKTVSITCTMGKGSQTWNLDVSKESGYVKLSYQDSLKSSFSSLSTGSYYLYITVSGTTLAYPLYLISDGKTTDASSSSTSYIAYSLIEPAVIVGQAGTKYKIKVEIRTKDNLRWNSEVQLNSISISNSLYLSSKELITTIEKGEQKGQFVVYVTQTKANVGNPNYLEFKYTGYGMYDKVQLIMKPGDLAKLTYVSGCQDGTISDPPTLKFTPWDAYGNSITDIFDSKIYTTDKLNKLTVGKSEEGYDLTTNNTVSENKYLNVQYKSTKPTTVKVTSSYYSETYTYKIASGDIDAKKTWAELKTKDENKVGEYYNIMIYPRDEYGNEIDDLTEKEKNEFYVYYEIDGIIKKNNISSTCYITDAYTDSSSTPRRLVSSGSSAKNKIQCSVNITSVGKIHFYVKYHNESCTYNEMSYVVKKQVSVDDPVAAGIMKRSDTMYQIDDNTLNWLHQNLVDGQDNRDKGGKFVMYAPTSGFTITPIYQGVAGAKWNLHMVVVHDNIETDYLIWKKSENVQIRRCEQCGGSGCWSCGWSGYSDWRYISNSDNTENAKAVRATSMIFGSETTTTIPAGSIIYFYLDNYTPPYDGKPSSKDGWMVALTNVPRPSNIESTNEVMIIGVEDNIGKNSWTDHDFNDVVFLIEGKPKIPPPSTSTEDYIKYCFTDVECKSCSITIEPNDADLNKLTTLYVNSNTYLSTTSTTLVSSKTLPTFKLTFYDTFGNQITNEEKIKSMKITPTFGGNDVELCIENSGVNKLVTVCSTSLENTNKWYYLVNGDGYSLILSDESSKIKYPLKINDGYDKGSSDDTSSAYLSPTSLTLVAGEEGKIYLELRTKDNVRKNLWYTNPDDNIKLSFSKDSDTCKYSFTRSDLPGQYYVYVTCIKKQDANIVTVTVEEKEVPQKVTLKIIPGPPAKSILYDKSDNKITKSDLGEVPVTEQLKIKQVLYDKYDNLITDINFSLDVLGIEIEPNVTKRADSVYSATPVANSNGEIIITIESTLTGEHILTGDLFPLDKYTITFVHGPPYASNCLLEVDKTKIYAGDTVKGLITLYDKYHNYIDASEYKTNSPFTVNYNLEGSTTTTAMKEYSVEKNAEDLNVLSYPTVLTQVGKTHVNAYIEKDAVKCVSCVVDVLAKDMDYLSSIVYRLEQDTNTFELLKNGTVEENSKKDPTYRLFPVDKYGNSIEFIPKEKLMKLESYLVSQKDGVTYKFKLNNQEYENQQYAEFVKNDVAGSKVTYSTLVGGFYDLIFTDNTEKLVYNITLAGSAGDGDASDKDAYIPNTYITSQNLKFVAGSTGNLFIEIRTEDNLRKNSWDGFIFTLESCNKTDKTFSYKQQNSGTRGVFILTVTTQVANTFPKLIECPLTVKVNDETVANLNPLMEVSPADIDHTDILEEYWKSPTSNKILKDGKADSDYVFEVKSFDKYNNLCETKQEIVDITVTLKGNKNDLTSESNLKTGYRKYTAKTSTSGTYLVSSTVNTATGKNYLEDATFEVAPGEIDVSKIVVKERATKIKAGENAEVAILAYDKNGNSISAEDLKDQFKVIFTDAGSNDHKSTSSVETNTNEAVYTSDAITVTGYVTPTVTYLTKSKIIEHDVKILVVAADVYPESSKLSRYVNNELEEYANGDTIKCNVTEPPTFMITLYDKYGNKIEKIPDTTGVVSPKMSGNDMEPITFTVTNKNSYFNLDFTENSDYVHIYSHLVSGLYDFSYNIKSSSGQTSFKYTISLVSDSSDDDHGNGDYDISKCEIKPKELTFYAGEYDYYTLEVRTKKGKLYNDELNIEDITAKINKNEPSFKYSVTKSGAEYGIYKISVYCEKKGRYELTVSLKDLTTSESKGLDPVYFNVLPLKVPYPPYTVIMVKPADNISATTPIEITFKLADKFNNRFENRTDIIDYDYFIVTNNNASVTNSTKELFADGETFKVTLDPIYPPRSMNINVVYNDGDDSVVCFPEDVQTYVTPEYGSTKVESKNAILIYVGEILDMRLFTFDELGICLDSPDFSFMYNIKVDGPLNHTKNTEKNYKVKKVNDENADCQNKYEIITTDDDKYTIAGKYYITVTANSTTIATFDQTCLGYDKSKLVFTLDYVKENFNPDNLTVDDTIDYIIGVKDAYGNEVTDSIYKDLTVSYTKSGDEINHETIKTDSGKTQVTFSTSIHITGKMQLHLYYKETEVLKVNDDEDLPIFTIGPGPCYAKTNEHFDLTPLDLVQIGENAHFTFKCYDKYNNPIDVGGEKFISDGIILINEMQTDFETEVFDLGNGNYSVQFIPPLAGKYVIGLVKEVDSEAYGEDVIFNISKTVCSGDTPYLCPNMKKCVSNRIQCITPENDCPSEKPFYCEVDKTFTCVASQIDCDCPSGFIRCDYMHYCVPESRPDMCASYLMTNARCKKLDSNYILFKDGICRNKNYGLLPNQRVCPIGKVLCADLSCRDSYPECYVSDYCSNTQSRCVEQTCADSPNKCPSTITCQNESDVVCPDGKCVSNEIECEPLTTCGNNYPYLCESNVCASDHDSCPKSVACDNGQSLCEDVICRSVCE